MREQHGFAEAAFANRYNRLKSHARQSGIKPFGSSVQPERHEPRPSLGHAQTKLLREIITQSRRTHFRDRESARRQNKRWRRERSQACLNAKYIAPCHA